MIPENPVDRPRGGLGSFRLRVPPAVLVALAFLVFSGCAEVRKERKTAAETADEAQLPEYVLHGVTHSFYDGDTIKLRIDFEKGAYFAGRQELAVENCAYVYYDTEGNVLSRGRSKSATLFSGSPRLVAENDVEIVSEVNGGVLKTDSLEWRGDKNQFSTNDFVTVRRVNGDMISGKGMVADLALRVVTIKRNVKGHFQENRSPSS
jgi:LPS export ABC transporter protein LptC